MKSLLLSILLVLSAAVASAQTVPPITNPTAVQFTVSSDHALIDHYELDILRPDKTALQTLNLGKPTPDATGVCVAPLNVQPVAFGTGYSVQLRAVAIGPDGPVSSANAPSDNTFDRKPGGPGKVTIK